MKCKHGNETACSACAGLLSVADAVAYRKAHPGTTQQEAAAMAGVTRSAMAHAENAVTKRESSPNVTDDGLGEPEGSEYATDAEIIVLDFLGLGRIALRVKNIGPLPNPLTQEMKNVAKQVVKVWSQFADDAHA